MTCPDIWSNKWKSRMSDIRKTKTADTNMLYSRNTLFNYLCKCNVTEGTNSSKNTWNNISGLIRTVQTDKACGWILFYGIEHCWRKAVLHIATNVVTELLPTIEQLKTTPVNAFFFIACRIETILIQCSRFLSEMLIIALILNRFLKHILNQKAQYRTRTCPLLDCTQRHVIAYTLLLYNRFE